MAIPDPYGHTVCNGKPLDNATTQAVRIMEDGLGFSLTIYQGIGGAPASGGTHLLGRAIDLAPAKKAVKVKFWRDHFGPAWYRPTIPGLWEEHIHCILIFEDRANRRGLAPAGFAQIGYYDRGLNGLANMAPDPNPYRPTPRAVFTLAEYERSFAVPAVPKTKVSESRNAITEAIHAAGTAATLLDSADGRPVAQAQIDDLRAVQKNLKKIRKALPLR